MTTISAGTRTVGGWLELALSSLAFAVFALLWLGVAIAVLAEPELPSRAWDWLEELPIVVRFGIWVAVLPIAVALAITESSWPIALKAAGWVCITVWTVVTIYGIKTLSDT